MVGRAGEAGRAGAPAARVAQKEGLLWEWVYEIPRPFPRISESLEPQARVPQLPPAQPTFDGRGGGEPTGTHQVPGLGPPAAGPRQPPAQPRQHPLCLPVLPRAPWFGRNSDQPRSVTDIPPGSESTGRTSWGSLLSQPLEPYTSSLDGERPRQRPGMYVPTHLCAHTPCACGRHARAHSRHVRTGLAGAASLRLLHGGGGRSPAGGAPPRERPRGAPAWATWPSPSPQPSVLAPRPRPRWRQARDTLTPASLLPRPAFRLRGQVSRTLLPATPGAHHISPMQARVPGSQPSQEAACGQAGCAGPPTAWGCGERAEKSPLRSGPPACLCAHF